MQIDNSSDTSSSSSEEIVNERGNKPLSFARITSLNLEKSMNHRHKGYKNYDHENDETELKAAQVKIALNDVLKVLDYHKLLLFTANLWDCSERIRPLPWHDWKQICNFKQAWIKDTTLLFWRDNRREVLGQGGYCN